MHCYFSYSVHPIPKRLAVTRNRVIRNRIEEDVQYKEETTPEKFRKTSKTSKSRKSSKKRPSGKTSKGPSKYSIKAPQLKDDLWHVVRSIDFDNCEEKVAIQVSYLPKWVG